MNVVGPNGKSNLSNLIAHIQIKHISRYAAIEFRNNIFCLITLRRINLNSVVT